MISRDTRTFVWTATILPAAFAAAVCFRLIVSETPRRDFAGCNLCWRHRAALELDDAVLRLSQLKEGETRTWEETQTQWKKVEACRVAFLEWDEKRQEVRPRAWRRKGSRTGTGKDRRR